MFLVQVNNDNVLQELVLVTVDRKKAETAFFETCAKWLSDRKVMRGGVSRWDSYDESEKQLLLDEGYAIFPNGAVMLIDTDGVTSDDEIFKQTGEVYYVWKERCEKEKRLMTPWSDPNEYEIAFDFIFPTPEAARVGKVDFGAEDEDWILCRETLKPLDI